MYGDAYFLLPPGLRDAGDLRFLATGLSDEAYVVVAPHGHWQLLARVNRAVAAFQQDVAEISPAGRVTQEAQRPVSLGEVFAGEDEDPSQLLESRDLRRVRRRGASLQRSWRQSSLPSWLRLRGCSWP